jgi:hypothetical protein
LMYWIFAVISGLTCFLSLAATVVPQFERARAAFSVFLGCLTVCFSVLAIRKTKRV